jgi:pimeloyl-ACP methyl ester carboxylesterase
MPDQASALNSSATPFPSLPDSAVRNIVLVHGAFADGSSWHKVIPLLQHMGYNVVAAQNPMTTLAEEAAATKRAMSRMEGKVILVGHSWGGAVVTGAGDVPQVAGLVYITAYAPEVGESANDASSPYGWTEGQKQIRVDAHGYATISDDGMLQDITECLPLADSKLALAVQAPSLGTLFNEELTHAAWKHKPAMVHGLNGGPHGSTSDGSGSGKAHGSHHEGRAQLPHGDPAGSGGGGSDDRRSCTRSSGTHLTATT